MTRKKLQDRLLMISEMENSDESLLKHRWNNGKSDYEKGRKEKEFPALSSGDILLVSESAYKEAEPGRFDLIVFKYKYDIHTRYIKRVIGLPGETVEFKDNRLYIDGELVEEDYLGDDVYTDNFGPFKVGEDCYFFCGDNRTGSYDSRAWGDVERDNLVGQAQCIYWPLARIGGL